MEAAPPSELWVVRPGTVPYEDGHRLQRAVAEARGAGEIPDVLLLLEHHPVYTKGRRTEPGELPMGEEWYRMQGIEVCETDRGGRVTYHGPGQLVAYPIVDIGAYGDDVHAHVRRLEAATIGALDEHGVEAQVFSGLTGIWTAGDPPIAPGETGPQGATVAAGPASGEGAGARKIGSIGVHVSRGITTHGLAVNVNNDLQPFSWIVPCGIEQVAMTSLARELGAEQELDRFATAVADRLAAELGQSIHELHPDELAERIATSQAA